MTTVEIRRAGPEDARPIADLHTRSFRAAYAHLPATLLSTETGQAQRVDFWAELLRRSDETTLVAVEGGGVIGFVRLGPSPDDDADETIGHIFSVHVDPDHTGTGVGRQLVAEAGRSLSERFQTATLWALSDNRRAQRFYEGLGWRKDGAVRSEKLSIGEDEGDEVEVVRLQLDLAEVEGAH